VKHQTARHLRPFMVKEWPALAGAAAMTVLLTAADLAKPWPLKIIVDRLFAGHAGAFTLTRADWRLLAAIAVLVVAIALTEAMGDYFTDLWLQSAGERITHDLRSALYDHLQRLSLRFHLGRQKGDLVTRVTGDVNAIGDLFADTLGNLAQSGLLLIGMLVVAFLLDPVLALIIFAMLPLLALVSLRFRRRVRAASKRQRAHEGEIASRANEALSAMTVVKALGAEDVERARVIGLSRRRMAIGIELSRVQARYDGVVGVLSALGTAAVLIVGVVRVSQGALTAGDLIVFAAYVRKANTPMRAARCHGPPRTPQRGHGRQNPRSRPRRSRTPPCRPREASGGRGCADASRPRSAPSPPSPASPRRRERGARYPAGQRWAPRSTGSS